MTFDLNDLLAEVQTKRIELGGAATTKDVMRELMHDAARAWSRKTLQVVFAKSKLLVGYPFRRFASSLASYDFCERLLASIERGHDNPVGNVADLAAEFNPKSRVDLPTPTEARKLRVITATVPALMPSSKRGVLGDYDSVRSRQKSWNFLWADAIGITAPQMAEGLKKYSDGAPIHRNQVFRLRDKLYDAIAAKIDDALLTRAAA